MRVANFFVLWAFAIFAKDPQVSVEEATLGEPQVIASEKSTFVGKDLINVYIAPVYALNKVLGLKKDEREIGNPTAWTFGGYVLIRATLATIERLYLTAPTSKLIRKARLYGEPKNVLIVTSQSFLSERGSENAKRSIIRNTYRDSSISYLIAENLTELTKNAENLKKIGPFDWIEFHGHGNDYNLILGGNIYRRGILIDKNIGKFSSILSELVADNGTVILNSCQIGRNKNFINDLGAALFAEKRGRIVATEKMLNNPIMDSKISITVNAAKELIGMGLPVQILNFSSAFLAAPPNWKNPPKDVVIREFGNQNFCQETFSHIEDPVLN